MKITAIISLTAVCLLSVTSAAFASGACCAVTKTDGKTPGIAITGAHSWGHEIIDGDMVTLVQQAVLVKIGMPVWRGIMVQGQIGAPIHTAFNGTAKAGYGGYIYGGGLGYNFPEIADRLTFTLSASATRSHGFLSDTGVNATMETFVISEMTGMAMADIEIVERFSLYAGIRGYSAGDRLEGHAGMVHEGERMGTFIPLFGVRWQLQEHLSAVLEGSFGHSNVVSLGFAMPLKIDKSDGHGIGDKCNMGH